MINLGIRAGHTTASCGASGLINENVEARKVKQALIKMLEGKVNIIDLQPTENTTYPAELMHGIDTANNSNLDLSISIHFNNAYEEYNGALGTEVEIYPNSSCKATAARIMNNIGALGFKVRGVQERIDLGELRLSSCPWIIVEVCFVEATKDIEVYKNAGVESVAKAIAEGILNIKLDHKENNVPADFNFYEYLKKNDDVMKCVLNGGFNSGTNGQMIENACKCHYIEYGKKEGRVYK